MSKICFFFLVSFVIFIDTSAQQISIDYSDPNEVSEKFLEFYFKGNWFDACKYCGTEGCEDQISFMILKMETDESRVDEGKCEFQIDSVRVDAKTNIGKCYFTKTCTGLKKPHKNHIDLKKIGDKWLVEYVWKRDKFL